MADIFLSYGSGDRERVRPLVEIFEAQGWSVWWDRHIQPGQSFDNVIQKELNDAHCVVVIWTEESIDSEWVKNEATIGLNQGHLVPALFDRVQIPLGFVRTHYADLVGWSADDLTPEFREFLNAVAGHLDADTSPLKAVATPKRGRTFARRLWLPSIGVLLFLLAGLLLTRMDRSATLLFDDVPENSIAVAAFEDLTPTYDQQWIGGAIVSTLRIGLPAEGLQVIGSSSYRENPAERQVANARYRIQGTVMRLKTMIRVTAELVQVENEHQLWADEFVAYEEVIASDLTAQNDIAAKIISAVVHQIETGTGLRPTLIAVNPDSTRAQEGSLDGLFQSDEAFPEFPSMDDEVSDE